MMYNKVMKTPEKIYYHKGKLRTPFAVEQRLDETDIEYTRTDAFIEKACELLVRMVWEVTYEDLGGDSVQHYDKMEFIEDFKNYMKGE